MTVLLDNRIHPRKLTWITQNDGLEKVAPFKVKICPFLISMLDFWGIYVRFLCQKSPIIYKYTQKTNHSCRPCFVHHPWQALFFLKSLQVSLEADEVSYGTCLRILAAAFATGMCWNISYPPTKKTTRSSRKFGAVRSYLRRMKLHAVLLGFLWVPLFKKSILSIQFFWTKNGILHFGGGWKLDYFFDDWSNPAPSLTYPPSEIRVY